MRIETSTPIVAGQFFSRASELKALGSLVAEAKDGVRRWLALVGHRKIGKTPLRASQPQFRVRTGP